MAVAEVWGVINKYLAGFYISILYLEDPPAWIWELPDMLIL